MHSVGVEAYFDSTPTISGAIRCIGPFQLSLTDSLDEQQCRALVASLTHQIESLYEASVYCVWGFQSAPCCSDHVLVIGGVSQCGWRPNLPLRSEVGYASSREIEWAASVETLEIEHRSGMSVKYHSGCTSRGWRNMFSDARAFVSFREDFDRQVWHPDTLLVNL